MRTFKFEGYDILIPDHLAEDYELPPDFQEWFFNGEPFYLMLEMLSVSSLKAKDPAEEIQKFYKHITGPSEVYHGSLRFEVYRDGHQPKTKQPLIIYILIYFSKFRSNPPKAERPLRLTPMAQKYRKRMGLPLHVMPDAKAKTGKPSSHGKDEDGMKTVTLE